ncbi:hypothetical protein [Lusitaniella coriacea]|uniref:hypothetical protein n=1 Tax=Lusitaniella coriacea TaxID=1983105 RepID=UPI003CF4C773
MLLIPDCERQFDCNMRFFRKASHAQRAIVISDEGIVTLLDGDLRAEYEYKLQYSPQSIYTCTISPKGDLLAIVLDKGSHLAILKAQGELIFEEKISVPVEQDDFWIEEGFQSCFFDLDGLRLWCARKYDEGYSVEFQIRDTASWQVQRYASLDNSLGSSQFSFYPHPENEIVAVWAAAGQDGQQVYWLYDNGNRIHLVEIPCLKDTNPPVFHPGGGEFLVVDLMGTLKRYTFPDCHLLGTCSSPWFEEDYFNGTVCYVSDDKVLANTEEGRMYLVDLETMVVTEEVIVRGYEPRPVELKSLGNTFLCGVLESTQPWNRDRVFSFINGIFSPEDLPKLIIFGGSELFCAKSSI